MPFCCFWQGHDTKYFQFLLVFRLRKATWDRLQYFSGGTMSELIEQLSKRDLLYPLLTAEHLKAIDRRVLMVYAAVELCFDRFGKESVLK